MTTFSNHQLEHECNCASCCHSAWLNSAIFPRTDESMSYFLCRGKATSTVCSIYYSHRHHNSERSLHRIGSWTSHLNSTFRMWFRSVLKKSASGHRMSWVEVIDMLMTHSGTKRQTFKQQIKQLRVLDRHCMRKLPVTSRHRCQTLAQGLNLARRLI